MRAEKNRLSFFDAWQRWLPGADKRITLLASIYNSKETVPQFMQEASFTVCPTKPGRP
jgi:hypothetical protein